MSERMTVAEAAKLLDMGNDALMAWLRSNRPPPFGAYVRQPDKRQGRYLIFTKRLLAYKNAEDLMSSTLSDGGNRI